MQKIATRIFISSSLVFGATGILMVLTASEGKRDSDFDILLQKLLLAMFFMILTSFAISVAGKYLNGKS